jgi:hypothetical protein
MQLQAVTGAAPRQTFRTVESLILRQAVANAMREGEAMTYLIMPALPESYQRAALIGTAALFLTARPGTRAGKQRC